MNRKYFNVALGAIGITAAMAIIMHFEGRLAICACGYVKFWHGLVVSSGNSQHLFDWYAFSHVLHGLGWYLLLWLIDRKKKLSMGTKFLIAVALAAGWEVLENSEFVINRYRSATISLDYFGDSIINAVGDIISMIIGFLFAWKMKPWLSVVLFVAIELMLLYAIRDSLIINIIMLIYPIEALKVWQAGV